MTLSVSRRMAFSLRSVIKRATDGVFSIFFAAECRVCQAVLDTASPIPVCSPCLEKLRILSGPVCDQCGRPPFSSLQGVQEIRCHLCRLKVYAFDRARSYGAYDEAMIRVVTLLKYEAVGSLGRWLAERLFQLVRADPGLSEVDAVVPVPLHKQRLRERGYNQAELVARPLARRMGLPLCTGLLIRLRPRPDKLRLARQERWRTVRGAYAVRQGVRVDNLRVLLVDDVFTTGATLDACSRVLKRAGAARVVGLTVARAVPDWMQTSAAAE